MGCYDSVKVKCPHCGALIEFQSKAGRCNLRTFPIHAVPMEIAVALNGKTECCPNCKNNIKLNIPMATPTTIGMFIS